jgi:flagellar hook assembly protein FlgD
VTPNPASGRCAVFFDCPASGLARVDILDVGERLVRRLADGAMTAGRHSVAWDGRDEIGRALGGGVYVARVESGRNAFAQKLILIR